MRGRTESSTLFDASRVWTTVVPNPPEAAPCDAEAAWAHEQGLGAMTLTTFADVPWNAPYYVRLGVRVVPEQEWTPGLRRIRDHEAVTGHDAWPRVVMRRPIGSEAVRR